MFIKKRTALVVTCLSFSIWPTFAFETTPQKIVVGVITSAIIILFQVAYDIYETQNNIKDRLDTKDWYEEIKAREEALSKEKTQEKDTQEKIESLWEDLNLGKENELA